jgi:formylglycine-generating enzyme required for sulfatase activity
MVFRLIRPGQFEMGAAPGDRAASANEKPPQTVIIERPFWAATFPLTTATLRRFLDSNDKTEGRAAQLRGDRSFASACRAGKIPDDLPAVGINASDAEILCEWLRGLDGRPYRLPTEAEWEFMARAGSSGAHWWPDGDDPQRRAVFGGSGPAAADPERANPWGLIDALGNVWEWTSSTYEPLASGSASRAAGPLSSEARVVRGGSWRAKTEGDVRVSRRRSMSTRTRADDLGVRLVCDL